MAVEELLEADEVFCTGTAVVVSPVGSITYQGKRLFLGSHLDSSSIRSGKENSKQIYMKTDHFFRP